ncbi:flavin reductase family protein [Rivibacter subsaxonicus]|uniref:Flavin reductase (DIM6/NTAB) family NADH-FMN oxidoreductase RutF n=1 Tax=Rivibacter subsaxonicus TaxID=457575 RepID=A0A4Q7VP55_9BURK|nr:flavin reductase family protein [Rivibacter subsaxonicus]RZT98183.1 flavin reductase (DIM6/NTAB) family NADH-FMN oxidoreductase RutF [Rivibacter subsaxonicus]
MNFATADRSARVEVELAKAYRLLNHGPTVLVGARHGGVRNVMAAAWNMPLDFTPPKIAVVIDKSTFTRGLVEASGRFTLSVPCRAQAALVTRIGACSGREIDKAATLDGLRYADIPDATLVEGCVAWLDCRLLPEPQLQQNYDLFLGEVTAAWADPRVWRAGRWVFDGHDELRTLHHVAGGNYFLPGAMVSG